LEAVRTTGTTDPALARLVAERLGAGTAVRLRVGGHCMTPCIRGGDVVTLEPLAGRRPGLGQILAFETSDSRLLIHRVVGWQRAGEVLTRGDVSRRGDAPLPTEAVLGTVTRVERSGRAVRLGLGPERLALAWLSRLGLLRALARLRW